MASLAPSMAMSAVKMGMDASQQRSALANQSDQIREAQKADQQERQRRLKRALATQRARFGAQGVSGGLSSEATLRGLVEEAKRDAADADSRASLEIDRLRDQADWSQRRNLLQLASPIGRSGASFLRTNVSRSSLIDG